MTPFKVLTRTEYLSRFHLLNTVDAMSVYTADGVMLVFNDDNIVWTTKEFRVLQETTDTHNFKVAYISVDKFKILENDSTILHCSIDDVKDLLKIK